MTSGSMTSPGWKAWLCAVVIASAAMSSAPAGAASTVPGVPEITSAVAHVQGVTITFLKPDTDGGSRLFDYRVVCTSTDGGATILRSTRHSPRVIGGMSVGKTYQCTVAARNALGLGQPSAASDSFIPLPEPAPRPVAIVVRVGARVEGVHVVIGLEPVDLGSKPVNYYAARCASSDGGVTRREHHEIPAFTVRHLTPGKTYTCTAAARNHYGYGPNSAPSAPVVTLFPPTAPAAPAITSATAIAQGVTLTFTGPADDGGSRVLTYRVRCTSSDGGETILRSTGVSPISVRGMSVGRTYTCTVAAHNAVGVGAQSAPSDPVVPLPQP